MQWGWRFRVGQGSLLQADRRSRMVDGHLLRQHHSVGLGCLVLAYLSHSVRSSVSTKYQIRPPAVTSYCHCSISTPL